MVCPRFSHRGLSSCLVATRGLGELLKTLELFLKRVQLLVEFFLAVAYTGGSFVGRLFPIKAGGLMRGEVLHLES